MSEPEKIVRAFLQLWAAGDLDKALQYVADDAVYALYISREVLPVGGETKGKEDIRAALRFVREQFDYVLFRPGNWITSGDTVRLRVEHMYLHRRSGEMLTGTFRIVFRVQGRLIVRADEYHDRAMVESFMRLFGA